MCFLLLRMVTVERTNRTRTLWYEGTECLYKVFISSFFLVRCMFLCVNVRTDTTSIFLRLEKKCVSQLTRPVHAHTTSHITFLFTSAFTVTCSHCFTQLFQQNARLSMVKATSKNRTSSSSKIRKGLDYHFPPPQQGNTNVLIFSLE